MNAGAAAIVAVTVIWLATKRLEFGWRMMWILVGFLVVCASSLSGGLHLMADAAAGIFTAAHGLASLISDL